ncbi:RNA-binding protein 12B [Rhineura floridana]|uniref:RNA-binding protein 12B n=1 Tax=Rhineura floridana TaxID=261503 RepID=UPI002AC87CFB|nr:RNA-binding protein 12B [Rhineura floridana]XP_061458975.1 RNA-binding protein 12B [Rhineura floridana]XP_061458983.1 RNA-binding protein 12B [Rhineura floridana]XP_061458990.1 RNA-binding protein 12B [Rhineura floridana]
MAVVIRLQGLPVVAGSADIRRFFSGLNIPDGGVHIIGGEKGEAFVIFATDEDARQAMSYSGGFIKDSRIEFFLSSKTEMQNIIEVSRKRYDHGGRETLSGSRRTGASNSGASGVGNLSNLVAVIKKGMNKSSYDSVDLLGDEFHSNGSQDSDTVISKSNYNQSKKEQFQAGSSYLFIRGMPYSATEDDILTFFSGLQVEEMIMLKVNGKNNGDALVKFATSSDATKGLQRDREYMGARFIEVRPSNEGRWIEYGGTVEEKMDHPFNSEHFAHHLSKKTFSSSREHSRREPSYLSSRKRTHSRSPPRRVTAQTCSRSPPQRVMARIHSRSPPRRVMAQTHSRSPPQRVTAKTQSRSPRRIMARTRSRSPPRRVMAQTCSRSPPRRGMARTYARSPPKKVTAQTRPGSPPWRVTARIRSGSPPRRVTARTQSKSPPWRVMAQSHSPFSGSSPSHSPHDKEYYVHIKNLSASVEKRDLMAVFGEQDVATSHISFLKPHDSETRKQDAIVMFKSEKAYQMALGCHKKKLLGQQVFTFPISKTTVLHLVGSSETKRSPERHHHVKERSNQDGYSGPKTCVYVRNFPFDVTNVEVQKFFAGFNIYDHDIYLLYDDKGIGLGEALVKFRTEDQARKAESLNRRRFLGTEVLLRCISEEQMQEFGVNVSSMSNEKTQDHLRTYEKGDHFYPVGSQGPSVHGNLKNPSNYRRPSDDFTCSPDHLRGPPPFREFGDEGIPGSFPEGHFMPGYNLSDGSDRVTLIKLKNVPYQASPNEILDFFYGYKIIPESLSILRNEYGKSSGEAILAMINYNEAAAAINELNDRPIGKRKISLSFG